MADIDNVVPMPGASEALFADSFVNLLAGLGVQGRDKFASQTFTHSPLLLNELEAAYRSDWIARKIITIPAWDMTREWRTWQADQDQIQLLETLEKKLFIQQKLQEALTKSRLYGGAVIIIGVDAGLPEEELDLELVTQDSLKFLHVVSRNQITTGPIIRDISSKYFGQPEYYEARQQPVSQSFQQAEVSTNPQFSKQQVRLHPSRVVKLIGMDTADQMLNEVWGDSVLQAVNDAVKMCGLVVGSLATLITELKVDIIKVPELKSILSTDAGTRKMISRFQAANAAKSVINTILIDGNEEWQRTETSLRGVPESMMAYLQTAAGAADIPATRFLGRAPAGMNATGESDIRNYYDRLAAEQATILTPTMTVLDEVIIRSALGERPPEVWYDWTSLWQMTESEKATIALQKAQAYQIDVTAAQLPPVALANARANQLIEDGVYPGLEKALEDAALEGDTIESENEVQPIHPAMAAMASAAENGLIQPPGQPGGPPMPPMMGGNVTPFQPRMPSPFAGAGDSALADFNECHSKEGSEGGEFCAEGGSGGGSGQGGKETGTKGDPKSAKEHGEKAARSGSREPDKPHPNQPTKSKEQPKEKPKAEKPQKEPDTEKEAAKAEAAKAKGEQKAAKETAKGEKKTAAEKAKAEKAAAQSGKKAEAEKAKGEKAREKEMKQAGKSEAKAEKAQKAQKAEKARQGGKGGKGEKAQKPPEQKAEKAQKQPKQPEPKAEKPQKSGGGGKSKSGGGEEGGGKESGGTSKGGGAGKGGGGGKGGGTKPSQQQKQAAQEKLKQLKQERPKTMTRQEWEAEKERLRKQLGA